MKLQPGDYVSTESMTEEQYHDVCKAFMDAGAGAGESHKLNYFHDKVGPYLGWKGDIGVYWGNDDDFDRKLTLQQILEGKTLPDPLEISSDKHVVFCEGGEINLGIHHIDFDKLEEIYLTAKGVRDGD